MKEYVAVSIIMSVYNAASYLRESMESILDQTFKDFEFIIIDDASTDDSGEIIRSYVDDRIIMRRNPVNLGLTKSLNRGLKIAQGEYIARMDADDISMPDRLEKQIHYMETHKNVALLSCSYIQFGGNTENVIIKMSENQIKGRLLFGSVLPHPGFVFRRSLYTRYHLQYNEKLPYAQDYDFQVKVSRRFKIACMPDLLIKYRVSESQVSSINAIEQQKCANDVRMRLFRCYGIRCDEKHVKLICRLYMGEEGAFTVREWITAYFFLKYLIYGIDKSLYDEKQAINEVALRYINRLEMVASKKWKKWNIFRG